MEAPFDMSWHHVVGRRLQNFHCKVIVIIMVHGRRHGGGGIAHQQSLFLPLRILMLPYEREVWEPLYRLVQKIGTV